MKTKKQIHFSVFSAALALIFLASCTGKDSVTTDTATPSTLAAEDSEDSALNGDVDDTALSMKDAGNQGGRVQGSKAAVIDARFCEGTTVVESGDNSNPDIKIYTVTYPAAGCTDGNGIKRSGKIIFSKNDKTRTMTITTDNLTINGIKVEGTRTIQFNAPEANGDFVVTFSLVGGKLTFPDGRTSTGSYTLNVKTVTGGSLDLSDDQLLTLADYNGVKSVVAGVNRTGKTYTKTVTRDLVRKFSCLKEDVRIPVSGVETIVVANGSASGTTTIDYGTGDCDTKASVSVDGKVVASDQDLKPNSKVGPGAGSDKDFSTELLAAIRKDQQEEGLQAEVNAIAQLVINVLFPKGAANPDTSVPKWNEINPKVFCAGVTSIKSGSTATLTFPEGGCTIGDTTIRKGSITVTESGATNGYVYTVTPGNFIFNGVKIEGTRTITLSLSQDGNSCTYEFDMQEGKLTVVGTTKTATRKMHYTMVEAINRTTLAITKTVKSTVTISSGVTFAGIAYVRTVTTDLVSTGCPMPASGVVTLDLTASGAGAKTTVTIDYGTGTCDNIAKITSGGQSKDIDLRPAFKRG